MAREYNMIYKHASGDNISIADGADNNLKDVIIYGNSVQNGTPSPDSPVDIQVMSGDNILRADSKNLWKFNQDDFYQSGNATYEITDQNTLVVTGTSSGTYRNVKFKLNIPDGTYTFSLGSVESTNSSVTGLRYEISYFTNGTRNIVTNVTPSTSRTITITNTSDRQYVLEFWATLAQNATNTATYKNVQVELGSTKTDFESSTSEYYPINLGVENLYYLDGTNYNTGTGITITENSDGSYTFNGTANGMLEFRGNCILNESHTLSYKCNVLPTVGDVLVRTRTDIGSGFGTIQDSISVKSLSGNVSSTKSIECVCITFASGASVNNFTIYLQLEKGSKVNSFTPYGTVPTELCEINIYNLFNKETVVTGKRLDGANGNYYVDEGYFTSDFIKITPGEVYTKNSPTADAYHRFCFYSSNDYTTFISASNNNTVTIPTTANYVRFCGLETELDTTQFEKGNTIHSYTSYGVPLPIAEDVIYSKGGKWYLQKEVGKVVLDGTQTGVRRETKDSSKWRFCVDYSGIQKVPNSTTLPIIISNKFISGTLTGQYNLVNCISTGSSANTYYRDITIYYDDISSYTYAQFQTWLNENNITVYYQLATPTTTEITDITLLNQLNALSTINGQNNITLQSSSGINTDLDFYYNVNNSDDYYQALIDNTATIETIVNVLPLNADEEIINLNEENSVINWTHSDFRYVQNTEDKSQAGFIGQFVARTFDGKVIDLDDDFNIENHEIEVYLGIVNEEDTGYISLGNFIIESIERDEVDDTTSFKSSDYTMFFNQKFNGDYTDGTFTDSFNTKIQNGETVTALWLAQYTCAQAGVTLGHTDFTNYDYVIASNQFDDQHTCRDVIKSIAKLAYSWARIGWDNKLYFDFTVDTEVNTDLNVITNENYYNLETQKEEIGEINKVILGSSIVSGNNQYIEDSASIEANGEHAIEIYDNPITYNDDTKIAALENGNVLYGLHYRPLSTLTTGHPWLQGNELIEIVDMEGNSIYTYPFDRTIEYNGHIKTKLDSYGATAVESTQSYYEGTDNIAKQTKVELDRQNQRLTVAISELTGEIQDVSDEFNTLVEPSKTVRGNPIEISDAGEYILKKFGLYGNSEQDETGSIDEPSEVNSVSGEHTLTIRSKNMFRALPTSITKSGVTMDIQDNIISLNGTHPDGGEIYYINNWQKEDESENDYFTLQPGTYTITGIIDDLPEGGLPRIIFVDRENSVISNANLYEDEWIQSGDTFIQSVTFTINDIAEKACFTLDTRLTSVKTFNISSLRLQLEKGSESTPYGQYIEPQEFIYDLNDIELCSIGTYKDSITYNITDEKWYLNRNVGYFLSVDGIPYSNVPSSTNCAMIYLYDENENLMFYDGDLLQLDIPIQNILSDKLEYKGFVTDIEDIYDEEGLYVCQLNQPPGSPYSKTILPIAMILKSRFNKTPSDFIYHEDITPWAQTENIKVYYPLNNQLTEELTDYDLVVQLNEILEKAKTYPTDIIIEDSANTGGTETELEITYMLDTEFNGNYATRTELQVTQNSISTVVADTVSTTLDPITLGLEDLGDRINTVEGNLQGDIDELRGDLGDYALQTDVVTLERSVTELQTSTAEVISVAKDIQVNGVSRVRTSTDFTFDEEGLMIAKTGAATKTQVTENGMSIYSTAGSTDEAMLTVNSQGVDAYNVKVGTYLLIGTHARMQDYEDGTGVFYIG